MARVPPWPRPMTMIGNMRRHGTIGVMDPRVWERFNRLLHELPLPAGHLRVLEVGITAGHQTLLSSPRLVDAARVGIDLNPPQAPKGYEYHRGDAHKMPFMSELFDVVLSNAMLEHDPKFWLSVGEMHRVLRSGGWLLLGAPAFSGSGRTLATHRYPVDCYRFGTDVVPVWFGDGFERVGHELYLDPPRLIAWGRKL